MACFTKIFPCCCPWSECCELPVQIAPAPEPEAQPPEQNAAPRKALQAVPVQANGVNAVANRALTQGQQQNEDLSAKEAEEAASLRFLGSSLLDIVPKKSAPRKNPELERTILPSAPSQAAAPKKEEPKEEVDRGSPTPTPRTLARMVVRSTTIQERSPAQTFSLAEKAALALKPLDTSYVPPSNVLETYNKPVLKRMMTDGAITQLAPDSFLDNKGDGAVVDG